MQAIQAEKVRLLPLLSQFVKLRSESIDWAGVTDPKAKELTAAAKALREDFEKFALADVAPGYMLSKMFGEGEPPPDLRNVRVSVARGLVEALDDVAGHDNSLELPLLDFWDALRIRAQDEF